MSENKDEKYRKLREEVNLLKEQLIKIADELEEPTEPEIQEEPIPIENKDTISQEKEETPEDDWEKEDEKDDWERKSYSRRRHRPDRFSFNPPFMDQLGDYIEDFVEDVMEGVSVGLEESLKFPHYGPNPSPRPRPRPRPRPWGRIVDEEAKNTSDIMSALANEHRVKILDELSYGGMYASDFQKRLPDISPSTLSSHLDVLEKAGLIVQERKRGRYIISLSGRLAVKMALQVNRMAVDAKEYPSEDFED